jgi:hypothetical protein
MCNMYVWQTGCVMLHTEQGGIKVIKQIVLNEGTSNSAVYLEIEFYPIICYMCMPSAW